MTSLRKLLFLVTTLALTAFALPSFAAPPPTKQYGLDITSSPPPAYPATGGGAAVNLGAGGGTVYWTISNQTAGNGNSAVGSFVIKKAPGVKISGPYTGPAGVVFDDQTQPGNLRVSGIGPLVPKQDSGTHQATISFTLTPEDPCAGPTTTWAPTYVVVTTGNFSNTSFLFTTDNGPPVLLTNQKTNIAGGTCYNITAVASPSGAGTLSCPAKIQSGSSGVCTATANAGNFLTGFSGCAQIGTTNQCTVGPVTSDTTVTAFFKQSTGKVGCISGSDPNASTPYNNYDSSMGKTNFTYDPDTSNVPFDDGWGLRRGNNKDNGACVLVDYAFTPATVGNGNVASLLFDQTSGQKASWKYLIVWPQSVNVDPNGWTSFRPLVSWGIANPTAATDFVPGLFCTDFVAEIDITTLNGAQLAARLPTMPDDSGTNGPFYQASVAHPTVYPLGGTAKVCIVRNGVTTGPSNTLAPFTEVLDEADTFVKQP